MHLRNQHYQRHGAVVPEDELPPAVNAHGSYGLTTIPPSRCSLTKRLILWALLLFQICFIGCFWLLQMGFHVDFAGDVMSSSSRSSGNNATTLLNGSDNVVGNVRVHFIRNKFGKAYITSTPIEIPNKTIAARDFSVSNFGKDFSLKLNRLNNANGIEYNRITDESAKVWCFREGSLNLSTSKPGLQDEQVLLSAEAAEQCTCQPGWHGRDCGQPEIIWRALLTARQRPFKLLQPHKNKVHRLCYMIKGNFFNLDLLEMQINIVVDVVDYFIIFYKNPRGTSKQLRTLERKLREILTEGNYFIFSCWYNHAMALPPKQDECTVTEAYKNLRIKSAVQWQPTDLFLYTDDRVLLTCNALKFLKYYAEDVHLIRLRLKYNIYGFYWQHPAKTHLTGLISSFLNLDNPRIGRGDPAQLLKMATAPNNDALIIGDLNHFGGWFCKYCQQPHEIIMELLAMAGENSSSSYHVQFPNRPRNRHIDVAYVQQLIGSGLNIDTKNQLLRVRRYADMYYAPAYADKQSWKLNYLLVNLYEPIYDDIDDE